MGRKPTCNKKISWRRVFTQVTENPEGKKGCHIINSTMLLILIRK